VRVPHRPTPTDSGRADRRAPSPPARLTNGWNTNCFGGGAAGVARVGNRVVLHGTICNDPQDTAAATCFVSLAGVSYTLPY
jgi:hypothetical protein